MAVVKTVQALEILHNTILGVSHLTAPSEVRDQMSFKGDAVDFFSEKLLQKPFVKEVVLLSTCNRIEIYCSLSKEPESVKAELLEEWCSFQKVDAKDISKLSYFYSHREAIHHLYRVISSLDSLVVGEGQIMGQVKEAFFHSCDKGYVQLHLNHLFQSAFALGKAIRTQTEINEGAVSISYAAVELCKKVFPNLEENSAAIIGSGEMGALAAQHLQQAGVKKFEFINRTIENALPLAQEFQSPVFGLQHLEAGLANSDIVISATGSPNFVIQPEMVRKALAERGGQPMILVDIAAPRDIDPAVNEVEGAYAFCIDDLQEVVRGNKEKRSKATEAAEKIIEEKLEEFTHWYRSLEVVPVIKGWRTELNKLAEQEIEKHKNRMDDSQREIVEQILHGVLGKWMHHPLEEIKEMSSEGMGSEAAEVISRLFHLRLNDEDKK